MIHSIAYVSKNRVLTKCAVVVTIEQARAFGANCPDCTPDRWPTEEEQIAAGFLGIGRNADGSERPFDKLAGRP